MPSIAGVHLSMIENEATFDEIGDFKSVEAAEVPRSTGDVTPQKRKLRSNSEQARKSPVSLSMKWKSPRRSTDATPDRPSNHADDSLPNVRKSPVKCLAKSFSTKPNWNPRDREEIKVVKEALHVSTAPSSVVCREEEQTRILNFCKDSVEKGKPGSLYVCGCPGTGKSLSMEKVKHRLVDWATEAGLQLPDILTVNCTSLSNTSDIFTKILGEKKQNKKKIGSISQLQYLQSFYSQQPKPSSMKMTLLIADELDYLITKDKAVLNDLFMLTTLPFSRCILIGIANAIDLADRFLPRLHSLNCKPLVITFRAYSKDQIIKIIQERLISLPFSVFQPQALELCARKISAMSGDMRQALCVCRSAIELVEAEVCKTVNLSALQASSKEHETSVPQEYDIVRVDHMAAALSKSYKSSAVDTIKSLPQHQQIILCSLVKLFRGGRKDSTVWELNKSYIDSCKSTLIPPVGTLELSNMYRGLNDQGLLKLGKSRDEKLKRVTLTVDEADITFALQLIVSYGSGNPILQELPPIIWIKDEVGISLSLYSLPLGFTLAEVQVLRAPGFLKIYFPLKLFIRISSIRYTHTWTFQMDESTVELERGPAFPEYNKSYLREIAVAGSLRVGSLEK